MSCKRQKTRACRHGANNTGRLVHEITAPSANVVYLGSAVMWDVQKITIK
jgi:hypothetical protein